MKWLFHLFLLALVAPCFCQPFVQYYDHGPIDNFRRLRATSDGGYILCGSQGGQTGEAWVVKVNENGVEEWSQLLTGAGEAFDIQEVIGGGYILTGGKAGHDQSDSLSIWRLDAVGDLMWKKRHAPAAPKNLGRSIVQLSTGGSIICGRTGLGGFLHDLLLMKVSEDGDMEWHKEIDLGGMDEALRILELPDGGFMVLAMTTADGMYNEPLLMRTDQDGDSLWTIPIAGLGIDIAHQMILTSTPGVLVVGRTVTAFGQPGDVWLDHRDLDGAPIWSNSIGSPFSDETGYDVVALQSGGYVIAVTSGTVGWIRVDAQGQFNGEAGADIGPAMNIAGLVDPNNGSYVIAGNVVTDTTFSGFLTDGFLLRTGPDGAMHIASNSIHSTSIYPNPASDVLFIKSEPIGPLRLEVIDYLGRKIIERGIAHGQPLNVDGVTPGVYILNILTGEGSIGSHKLLIQR